MNHRISKNGFHGEIEITLQGDVTGFELSPSQARRWITARCSFPKDCACGGNYGAGYAENSARIDYDAASESYWLIPSN